MTVHRKEWSSAYAWWDPRSRTFEQQGCRGCRRMCNAVGWDRLQGGRGVLGANIQGAHNRELCCMCLTTGTFCDERWLDDE